MSPTAIEDFTDWFNEGAGFQGTDCGAGQQGREEEVILWRNDDDVVFIRINMLENSNGLRKSIAANQFQGNLREVDTAQPVPRITSFCLFADFPRSGVSSSSISLSATGN